MAPTRREFLQMAGFSAIGLALPVLPSLAWARTGAPAAGVSAYPAAPGPLPARKAKRWAMTVKPGKCRAGCTDCITACHLEHNVPAIGNPKDDVHWIGLQKVGHVFPAEAHPRLPDTIRGLSVPVLCNHCENPPCVRVCPTQATFRRPDGIVVMDYHRCIGCRFCMAACPYGSRSMNWRDPRPFIRKINQDFPTRTRGVVEKCNFCEERLARGILPACVVACKEKAMAFGDLEDPCSEVRLTLDRGLSLRRRPELGTGPQIYYIL
ncbi:MAG: 4Fe-4S dicluster domain-containing protein [Proteobacteria bacterium]|nr:4Fe-4S dicluster domain-containing protein [Pseudomonadota bacterium]MBU4581847.1 4Fe-4S dicluster domain-containing protein [Pseudomonadota bacterium]MCG2741876.1 4Fe-4S dicluster domain-containing protein [Syntrophaceae bacterium]